MKNKQGIFSLDELCTLVEMNKRKIRFYIQRGLVERPEGTGKGAYYTHQHLEQLLTIRKWKEAGLSLERIQELLTGGDRLAASDKPIPPFRPKKAGSVEVWSHLYIDDGVELHIESQRSGLSPEQVRALSRNIMKQYKKIKGGE